jgi:hypothetical protein
MKDQFKNLIKEEIRKVLKEATITMLRKGDKVKVVSKLGNILTRSIDVDPSQWPQAGHSYLIAGVDLGDRTYGFKDLSSGETRYHDIEWIDKQIKPGKIQSL